VVEGRVEPFAIGRERRTNRMRRARSLKVMAALLGLAACAAGPPVPADREVAGDPAETRRRIEAELARLDLAPAAGGADALEARRTGAPAAWADCGPVLLGDGDDRYRMAMADARAATVRVTLAPAPAGTRVAVAVRATGSYRNPFTTYRVDRPCPSTGLVESRLLAAADG
jgi:hypothetical protein